MMLADLEALLASVNRPEAVKAEYLQAIQGENCLGKRSVKTRMLTSRYLVDLYALDPAVTLFRALLFFWQRDGQGHPLLALLCAYARDAILRMGTPFLLALPEGARLARAALEAYIDELEPGRFSKATLQSTAQNMNATWTKSGHLSGRVRKVRSQVTPTPGAVSYALLLGYLIGIRGKALFSTEYAKLLACSLEQATALAEEASRRGWIVFKRVGDVSEVLFPNLLNAQEMEWVREQS
jgi:hypothetical protein